MSKTLQEILEQDAGGKFPFWAAQYGMVVEWVGRSSTGKLLGMTRAEHIYSLHGTASGWTFLPPEKPKVLRAEWIVSNSYPTFATRSPFLTDAEAKERGYLRKIPGTEMEFEA